MSIISNAEAQTLRKFLIATVEPGSTVITDGWSAYPKACRDWFDHEPHPVAGSGKQTNELLPAVHRVAALCKRCTASPRCASGGCWALIKAVSTPSTSSPTWKSSASPFNRRHCRARGLLFYRLLQYAVGAQPLTYRELVANPQPKAIKPPGVKGPRSRPGNLAQPPQDRPWRATHSLE